MGTPEFAVPSLLEVARRCEIVAVVTQPDRPRGRGRKIASSPVADAADGLELLVLKPEVLDETMRARIAGLAPDLFAVVAYGAILAPKWLGVPRQGAINLHGSLLPEYRGASPVQRALWDGRSGTGVTTIWMDQGIDTGDMILQRWAPIAADDTALSLGAKLARLGAPLLAESLVQAAEGRAPRRAQPKSGASYARKLEKRDGVIDWNLDAETVWNRIRAVTPWPGATTALAGRRLVVLSSRPHDLLPAAVPPGSVIALATSSIVVACAGGALEITEVKPEGRGAQGAGDWGRGARITAGARFEWKEEEPV